MTASGNHADHLERLLRGLADDTLTSDDRVQLAAILKVDANARQTYYEHVKLTALLRREGRRDAAVRDIFPNGTCRSAKQEVESASLRPFGEQKQISRIRNWLPMLGASVLVAVGLLSVGEATGITQIVPTVIRIMTGEGALVIEVDDPSVSVSLDGEDVTITGAGIHELRLKPGTHNFRATKDGKPLYEEVVTIERGGRKVLRVVRENSSSESPLDRAKEAERNFAEVERIFRIGHSLYHVDLWQAEVRFREALSLYDQLVDEFPDVPSYQQRRSLCNFMLGTTLGMQAHETFVRGSHISPEEASRAVAAAKEATELLPRDAGMFTQLGRACYRAKDWNAALAALEKGPQQQDYNGSQNRFLLAMVHWQLGNREQARQFYDQAVQWMDEHKPDDKSKSMRRHRDEAAELLDESSESAAGDGPEAALK